MPDELKELIGRGTLIRVSGVGGESTGWAIDLDESLQIAGKPVSRLEINHDPSRWSKFENQHVEVKGELTFRQGIERGRWPVLDAKEMKAIPINTTGHSESAGPAGVKSPDDMKAGIDDIKAQLASKKKDAWDKVQIMLMPLVIAVTGAVATSLLNSQQERNAQVIAQAQIQAAQIQELAKLVAEIPPSKDFLEVNPKNRVMVASLASYGPRAVPVLISLFRGTPLALRFEIVHALAQIGDPAVQSLLEALKAPDPDVRVGALKVLEEMRTNQVSAILEVLKS